MKNNKNNNNNKFKAIWQQTEQGTDLSIEFVSGPLASIGTTNIKITFIVKIFPLWSIF